MPTPASKEAVRLADQRSREETERVHEHAEVLAAALVMNHEENGAPVPLLVLQRARVLLETRALEAKPQRDRGDQRAAQQAAEKQRHRDVAPATGRRRSA